jgi:hypothetical protein
MQHIQEGTMLNENPGGVGLAQHFSLKLSPWKISLMRLAKIWITSLGLLAGACTNQVSEADVARLPITDALNKTAGQHIKKRYEAETAAANLLRHCDEAFNDLRIGMRIRGDGPLAQCANISYSKTLRNNHEVWSWKNSDSQSIFIDNGVLTTINGTIPSSAR